MPAKRCAWCANDLRRGTSSPYCSPQCAKEDGAPEDAAPPAPKKSTKPSPWTPELDAKLRAIAASGGTTLSAARDMGMTKNAVIGRALRIGVAWAGSNNGGGRVVVAPPPPPQADFPAYGMCVFPIGHPRDKDFRFCGEKSAGIGKPYCSEHMKLCWTHAPAPRNLTDAQRAEQGRRARANLEKRGGP